MPNPELRNLRRARSRCHFRLKQAEALAEGYRAKLVDLETRIQAIAPELDLPPRFRNPNPVFARGELTKMALDMLREAGGPVSIRDMVRGALAAKGVRFPDRRMMRHTRTELRAALNRFGERGLVVTVGTGKGTRRVLASG
jgi:hypothetical protein